MGYAILAYALIGALAYLWYAPSRFKKENIKSLSPGRSAGWLLVGGEVGLVVILFALALWPIAVPIWIWSERSAKRENERYLKELEEEKEKKKNDPNYGLTIDQKIEKLKALSEES